MAVSWLAGRIHGGLGIETGAVCCDCELWEEWQVPSGAVVTVKGVCGGWQSAGRVPVSPQPLQYHLVYPVCQRQKSSGDFPHTDAFV